MPKIKGVLSKLQPYNIVKGVRYLKHFGPKAFWIKLSERMEPEEVPYGEWYAAYQPTEQQLLKQKKTMEKWTYRPLISIVVPVYRTPERFLREMLESVCHQTYDNWELIAVNADPADVSSGEILKTYRDKDDRIRVYDLENNAGIAENTNAGIRQAKGEWVAFLDHDDLLSPAALFVLVRYMQDHPDVKMIYTDEDKVRDDGKGLAHIDPNLKPDFNLDLLRANNYICHFLCVRSEIAADGLRAEYDGAQDYDFIFRCAEQSLYEVGHVPEIVYHWRTHASSTADNPLSKQYAYEAGKRAIEAHLRRCHIPARVECKKDFGFYKVTYPVHDKPLVSIIIPNKDQKELLKSLIDSMRCTTYDNIELIIVENNSETKEIFAYYKELAAWPNVHLVRYQGTFNYSAINNLGVRHAKGEYLLFLNNDMQVISPDWIEGMLGVCQREDAGAVGVRLYYPDDTYQHAGIVIGIGGIAGSMFVDMKRGRSGYMHKADLMMDVSAVTAACMMVPASVYRQVGGFDEQLGVAFNDVDLCLRIGQTGKRVVYNPAVELYHLESKTRGREDSKEKVRRFQGEIEYMRTRWEKLLIDGDPMYNKNLSLSKWNYSLKNGEHMR